MEYNLTKKIDGKWVTFGSFANNQYGNLQASFKKTPEFMKFINESEGWVNFSAFWKKSKDDKPISNHSKAKADGYVKPTPTKDEAEPFDDCIPFVWVALIAPLLMIGGIA